VLSVFAVGVVSSIAPALAAADLPDGRGYEQATPVDKNGANMLGRVGYVQAAAAGGGITSYALAPVPGAEGAQEFEIFLSSRGSDNWTTQGLLPSAASGPQGKTLGWTEDLSTALVVNRENGALPYHAYLRSSADGALESIGELGTRLPNYVGASADHSVVALETKDQLVPAAVDKKPNVYVWSRASGVISLASVLNNGASPSATGSFAGPYNWFGAAGPPSTSNGGVEKFYLAQALHAISQEGSKVYFTAGGANAQLYVRLNPTAPQSAMSGEECAEPAKACTVHVSASQRAIPDPNGEKPAIFLGATEDGSSVYFMSAEKLTEDATTGPADAGSDLYRYDVATGDLTDLVPDSELTDPNGAEVRGIVGISSDGSYVYFVANGVLAAGGTAGNCGVGAAATGSCNLYLWHNGSISFVSPLSATGELVGASPSDGTNWAPATRNNASLEFEPTGRVSADGRTLLFRSRLQLTPFVNEGVPELYRYGADTGQIDCVSCSPAGAPPTVAPSLQQVSSGIGPLAPAPLLTRNLSADGTRVFFDTPDPLVGADANGVSDVYEWEAAGTGSCQSPNADGGCLYLISTGTSPAASHFADASESGADAFFFTAQPLVGQDRDELIDVYDARVGGGLASQNPPASLVCSEEGSCRGQAQPAPAANPSGTASFVGPGNRKSKRVRCRKGTVRRHGHCVKRRHKRRHGNHRGNDAGHHSKQGRER
jgi:hypothetical protein